MSRDLEMRRARERESRRKRIAQGICERCPARARNGLTTCEPCGHAESDRRADYLRRCGARPRYADGRGYGHREQAQEPRLDGCPASCRKCAGFIVDLTIEWRCVNCGWRGWPAVVGETS